MATVISRILARCLFASGILAVASAAAAQGPIGGFSANLAVPASPAFAALDLSPEKVTRPASPNQLASTLINGIDGNGVLQQGIAIDVAPFLTWGGRRITHSNYVAHRMIRFLSRVQTSLATAKAAGDVDKGTRLAFGTAFTLFDLGDPRANADLAKCLATANRVALATAPPVPPPAAGAPADAFAAEIATIEKGRQETFNNTCREDARKFLWNRSSASIGIAPTWLSATGSFKDLELDGRSVWAAVAYGFEQLPGLRDNAQLTGYVEHRGSGRAAENEDSRQVQTSLGARFRFGSGAAALSIETVRTTATGESTSGWSLAVSGERKLTADLWLELSIGGKSRPGQGGSQTFVLNTLNWRFAER